MFKKLHGCMAYRSVLGKDLGYILDSRRGGTLGYTLGKLLAAYLKPLACLSSLLGKALGIGLLEEAMLGELRACTRAFTRRGTGTATRALS
jgi:hypothetical protein